MTTDDTMQEITYEPHQFSDLTLHYQTASFHVHSLILHRESAYFAVLIEAASADDVCTFTDQCSTSCRRCITLNESFGGFDATVNQIKNFLDHLYSPHSLLLNHVTSQSSKEASQLGRVQFDLCSEVMVEKASTKEFVPGYISDMHGGFITVTYNSTGTLTRLPITSPRLVYTTTRPIFHNKKSVLRSFLTENEASIKLAHYFDCQTLLQFYELVCRSLVQESLDTSDFAPLWGLLVLAEMLHWDIIKQRIISALGVAFDFQSGTSWQESAIRLSPRTLVDLIQDVAQVRDAALVTEYE
jgi:hypothetical protein